MTTVVLVRHGLTDAVGTWMNGALPGVPLNAVGLAQAAALPARLAALPIAAIYASPFLRTQQTAAPLAAARGLSVQDEPRLREVGFGRWEGVRFDALRDDPHWRHYNVVRSVTRPPDGGETLVEVQARAVAALLDVVARHDGETVVLVSHGDTLRALLQYLLAMPIDNVQRLELSPASVSVVRVGPGVAPVVLQVNGEALAPVVVGT